jgi:hypothetical protein
MKECLIKEKGRTMKKLLFGSICLYMPAVMSMTLNMKNIDSNISSFQLNSSPSALVQKIEAPPSINSNMTCFSTKWFELKELADLDLARKFDDLKELNPEAFYEIDSNGEKLQCFVTERLKSEEIELFDQILSAIDREVESEVVLLVPSEKENKVPKINQTIHHSDDPTIDINDRSFMRNHDKSLLRKIGRAEMIVGGVEAIGMGTLMALPRSITKWDEDFISDAKRNYKRAWSSAPVWDKDEWAINYIGHPYAGAIYYNSLRSQNASVLSSFVFSTAQSVIWEYGIEAAAEQPSIQDLLFTSTIGSVAGELAHQATLKMRRNGMTGVEKVIVTIINPSYVLNNGYK